MAAPGAPHLKGHYVSITRDLKETFLRVIEIIFWVQARSVVQSTRLPL